MIFENLKVTSLVVHEVHKRDSAGEKLPTFSESLEALTPEAHEVFRDRVGGALASPSRCVEMALKNKSEGSTFALVKRLLVANEAEFISTSRAAATNLSSVQTSIAFPGGLLMVFSGTVGAPEKRYTGFLKAEPQNGFRQGVQDGRNILEFLNKLFLTPDAKVYKIGMFIENDAEAHSESPENGFRYFLFDANITSKETAKAATYFYESFLGFTLLQSGAKTTRKFIEVTKNFINQMSVDEETKLDLRSALTTYMRVDQNSVASVNDFGERYFSDPSTKDAFVQFAEKHHLPAQAFTKDLSESKSLLRRRKVRFGGDVQLSVPAESFAKLVSIKKVSGDNDAEWTQITIREKLLGE